MSQDQGGGRFNSFAVMLGGAVLLLLALGAALYSLSGSGRSSNNLASVGSNGSSVDGADESSGSLLLYCAAGMRLPIEQIVADYEQELGVPIQVQYGGSNTLLSQLEVARSGDLYLAADDSYTQLAQEKGLVQETLPLAEMRPVIAVKKGNPQNIQGIEDLLREDVRTALGNPDQAAVGKAARKLLTASGQWEQLEQHVTQTGVFKPTVPEVANDVKLGSADAAIVWDTTLAMYPELQAVRTPELDNGISNVTLGVLTATEKPRQALKFARFVAARDRGLVTFKEKGFEAVDGDVWVESPEINFFCGAVNRRAVEEVIKQFEQREGVVVNTDYNGCGILTAKMKTIQDQQQSGGFPDTYMACDRYYLDSVKNWFQDDVDVSDTDVVIAVPKGNPAGIQSVKDLAKPGVRVAVGQPDQCTIGVLTRQVLKAEGVYDQVMKNVATQTATSALLLPTVTTGSVDAALVYATDTKAESDKVDVIRIGTPESKAIQPFAIARSSDHKYLSRRLYQAIANARQQFETAGFHFRLEGASDSPAASSKQ